MSTEKFESALMFHRHEIDEILIKLNTILRNQHRQEIKMSELSDAVAATKVSVDAAVVDLKALADALAASHANDADVVAAVASLHDIATGLDAAVAASHA